MSLEITVKFENEADAEKLAEVLLEVNNEPALLAEFTANTVERVGDTIFFTKQEKTADAPSEVVSSPDSTGDSTDGDSSDELVEQEFDGDFSAPFSPLVDLDNEEKEFRTPSQNNEEEVD